MIKFKDYLTELFDKPERFIQIHKSDDVVKYAFNTDSGHTYTVTIENLDGDCQISFSTRLFDGSKTHGFRDELKGNATKVISTVAAICDLYFAKHVDVGPEGDIRSIYYIADDPSRIKLYNAVIKKFLNDRNVPYQYVKQRAMGQFVLFP